jgi:hypothetical protein
MVVEVTEHEKRGDSNVNSISKSGTKAFRQTG